MGKFVFRAYSPRGTLEERTVRGDTAGRVNRDLEERGYRVVALRPARSGWRWVYRQMPTFFRVKTSDIVQFSR
jgi:type II secretory pathway component PulF